MLDGVFNTILSLGQSLDKEQTLRIFMQLYLSKKEVADPAIFLIDLKQLPAEYYPDYFKFVKLVDKEKLIDALARVIPLGEFTDNQKEQLFNCSRLWMSFNDEKRVWVGLNCVPEASRWEMLQKQSLIDVVVEAFHEGEEPLKCLNRMIYLINWLPQDDLFRFISLEVSVNLGGGISTVMKVCDLFTRCFLLYHFPSEGEARRLPDYDQAAWTISIYKIRNEAMIFFKYLLKLAISSVRQLANPDRLSLSINYILTSASNQIFSYRLAQFCLSELLLNPAWFEAKEPSSPLCLNDLESVIRLNFILSPDYWRKAQVDEASAMASYQAAIPETLRLFSPDWASLPFFQGVTLSTEKNSAALMIDDPFHGMTDEAFHCLLTHYRPANFHIYSALNARLGLVSGYKEKSFVLSVEAAKRIIIHYPFTVFSDAWFESNFHEFTKVIPKDDLGRFGDGIGLHDHLDVNNEFEALVEQIFPSFPSTPILKLISSDNVATMYGYEFALFRLLVNLPTQFYPDFYRLFSDYSTFNLMARFTEAHNRGAISIQKRLALIKAQVSFELSQIVKKPNILSVIVYQYNHKCFLDYTLASLCKCVGFVESNDRCDLFLDIINSLNISDSQQRAFAIVLLIPMMPEVDHERYLMGLYTHFDQILSLLSNDDTVLEYLGLSQDIGDHSGLTPKNRHRHLEKICHFLSETNAVGSTSSFQPLSNFQQIKVKMLDFTVNELIEAARENPTIDEILGILKYYCPHGQAGRAMKRVLDSSAGSMLRSVLADNWNDILYRLTRVECIDIFFGDSQLYKMLLQPPRTLWSFFRKPELHGNPDLLTHNDYLYYKSKLNNDGDSLSVLNGFENKSSILMNLLAWVNAYFNDEIGFPCTFLQIAKVLTTNEACVFEHFEKTLSSWLSEKKAYTPDQKKELYQQVIDQIPADSRWLFTGLQINGGQTILEFLEQGDEPRGLSLSHA